MKENDKTQPRGRDADEIDIIELMLQLWRSRGVIALFVVLGLVISGVWVSLAPQKWSSVAIITRPDSAQIASYTHAISVLDGRSAPDSREIESRAISRFAVAFAALADTLHNQQHQENLTIDPSVKGQSLPLKVSYQATSAREAQAKLAAYIDQTDQKIAHDLLADLQENLRQKVTTLNSSLVTQEKIAQEQKDLRIEQIKEALKFAEAANISYPQIRQGENATQDTLLLLGSEALSAMVERESTRPLTYPGSYFLTRQQLFEITDLNADKITLSAYRYVLKPTLPIHRDGPRKVLSLMLGGVLGLFIGCGVVMGRKALRDYKKSH
ncbi:LPS O-antigen chain length determinant protein WzzB [Citrobacter sp. JGM124]|uniref:LPS O-antigen chain length determinant protein WzzB n=1 Tax=Citrobacter sp. JGM124 TaxID=2799789 RepID=UPI001BAB17D7|nr:LPS O-antigen chain length determinant protein WzzB [Citrobacter sp. JGM124]MBS0847964.1 LPS O-antigen chain length determinant protein WzzB [Citrobacter sp. JGM124]